MNTKQLIVLGLFSLAASTSRSAQTTTTACMEKIKNQAGTPSCLMASSNPTLGMLFPIDQKWFVDSTGKIGLGTTTPQTNLEIFDPGSLVEHRLSIGNGGSLDLTYQYDGIHHIGFTNGSGTPGTWLFRVNNTDGSTWLAPGGGKVGIGVEFPTTALDVAGTITGAVKNFRIDHPLDPANKTLVHSCIESSEMMNLYRGNVVLDGYGEAVVEMPSWFEALNKDFSYQLTAIGVPAPGLYVADEIVDGQFRIAGGSPGMKVSWLVTGVRHDAYAVAHPLQVEQDKGSARGTFLYPKEVEESFIATPR